MEKVLKLFFLIMFIPLFLTAQENGELAALQKQAREKEAQLKKIKQQEQKLSKEIETLTQKEQKAQKLAQRLQNDLAYIGTLEQQNIKHKNVLDSSLPMWQTMLQAEANTMVTETFTADSFYGSNDMLRQLIIGSLITRHAMFLAKISEEIDVTGSKIEKFKEQNQQIAVQKNKADQQKESLHDTFKKKQQDLSQTKEEYNKAQAQLKELKASAEQMQKILKEAEERRKKEAKKAGAVAAKTEIGIAKNSLPWPVSGKIISGFGKEYNSQLKTWIFRDGVKISSRVNEPVVASEDGAIIFAGEFRSYGNVVIVDHGQGFFTIYGFLNEIRAVKGNPIHKGQILGLAGKDTQGAAMGSGANAVYFEIRSGTTAVDPEIWLQKK